MIVYDRNGILYTVESLKEAIKNGSHIPSEVLEYLIWEKIPEVAEVVYEEIFDYGHRAVSKMFVVNVDKKLYGICAIYDEIQGLDFAWGGFDPVKPEITITYSFVR